MLKSRGSEEAIEELAKTPNGLNEEIFPRVDSKRGPGVGLNNPAVRLSDWSNALNCWTSVCMAGDLKPWWCRPFALLPGGDHHVQVHYSNPRGIKKTLPRRGLNSRPCDVTA